MIIERNYLLIKIKQLKSFNIILFALLTYCNDNPFSDDSLDYADGLSLRGKVILDDGSKPDQVYVWLQELNTGVYTDESGNFKLFLPPAEAQPGVGYTGSAKVYFYLGNYQFEERNVLLLDGKFQLDRYSINSQGYLKNTISLEKLLSIRTTVEPNVVGESSGTWLTLKTYISPHIDSVVIQTFKHQRDQNMFTNVYFQDKNKPIDEAVFVRRSVFLRTYAVRSNEVWYLNVHSDSLELTEGLYDVIPYIKIIQDDFPFDMLLSIGADAHTYNNTYLNIPFKETTGQLRVTTSTY